MSYQSIFRNFLITRRQFILGGFKLTLLGLITSRLAYLQLIKHDKYSLLSKQNSITTIPIPPIRGEILDRNGRQLALNRRQFKLVLTKPNTLKAKATLAKIFALLNLSVEDQDLIKEKIRKNPLRVTLLHKLDWEQVITIEQNIFELEYASIVSYFVRFYPQSKSTSHPIGYIAKVDKLESIDIKGLNDFQGGKNGIEKYYDASLMGKFGYKQLEVDAHGNIMREMSFIPSQAGTNMVLSIDNELQDRVYQFLGEQSGCVIVVDTEDQQILSLVSTPGYENNLFAAGSISSKYWQELNGDIKLPLFNKAVQAAYPPGSIFKIVTLLAALESGFDADVKVVCKSAGFLGDHFHCWNKSGHGPLNMEQALGCSCNYYMYHIARSIGHKAIINMAQKLGLGQKVGIDLPGEVSGFLPQVNMNFNWKLAHTLNLVIGQGLITATPIQLSRLVSIVAAKGRKMNYTLKQTREVCNQYADIDPRHFDVVHSGMRYAVNNPGGTARAASGRVIVAAKTGTSQVQSKRNSSDDFSLNSTPWLQRNHALSIGFAPFDKPKYSVAVVIEHGGSGGKNATPIVGKIFDLLC